MRHSKRGRHPATVGRAAEVGACPTERLSPIDRAGNTGKRSRVFVDRCSQGALRSLAPRCAASNAFDIQVWPGPLVSAASTILRPENALRKATKRAPRQEATSPQSLDAIAPSRESGAESRRTREDRTHRDGNKRQTEQSASRGGPKHDWPSPVAGDGSRRHRPASCGRQPYSLANWEFDDRASRGEFDPVGKLRPVGNSIARPLDRKNARIVGVAGFGQSIQSPERVAEDREVGSPIAEDRFAGQLLEQILRPAGILEKLLGRLAKDLFVGPGYEQLPRARRRRSAGPGRETPGPNLAKTQKR